MRALIPLVAPLLIGCLVQPHFTNPSDAIRIAGPPAFTAGALTGSLTAAAVTVCARGHQPVIVGDVALVEADVTSGAALLGCTPKFIRTTELGREHLVLGLGVTPVAEPKPKPDPTPHPAFELDRPEKLVPFTLAKSKPAMALADAGARPTGGKPLVVALAAYYCEPCFEPEEISRLGVLATRVRTVGGEVASVVVGEGEAQRYIEAQVERSGRWRDLPRPVLVASSDDELFVDGPPYADASYPLFLVVADEAVIAWAVGPLDAHIIAAITGVVAKGARP